MLGQVTFLTLAVLSASALDDASQNGYIIKTEDGSLEMHTYSRNEAADPTAVVNGQFKDNRTVDGWTYINLATNTQYDDMTQAYAAGYLEANLTAELIAMSYYNMELPFDIKSDTDHWALMSRKFVRANFEYMMTMIKNSPQDPFWYQVNLVLYQIQGMNDAVLGRPPTVNNDIDPLSDMFVYQWNVELFDLFGKFTMANKKDGKPFGGDRCSGMIRNTGDDLLASHVTWSTYGAMLRTMKKYTLPYKKSSTNSTTVPGSVTLFSSIPGTATSYDDYYSTNQNMVILETTNEYYNSSLYDYVVPIGTIPYWIKIIVANRLAASGSEWAQLFSQYNMGTYNNQWMVVDYKKFSNGIANEGTLWILETLPGVVTSADESNKLNIDQKAWVSYNSPYFENIRLISEQEVMVAKYGPFYSYDNCPRANIFHDRLPTVVDLKTGIELMRYNEYQTDPNAKCDCEPVGASGENGISARCDLNPTNGTYRIPSEGPRCHGGTDMKMANVELAAKVQMVAICGPTHETQQVFDWSEQEDTACKNVRHVGQPERFPFSPVHVDL